MEAIRRPGSGRNGDAQRKQRGGRGAIVFAAATLLIGACIAPERTEADTPEDTSFKWTRSDSAMAAGCVLQGPDGGRYDVRYESVSRCVQQARPNIRVDDALYIATFAVDCGTWSEGEDAAYRIQQITSCLEDALPRARNY